MLIEALLIARIQGIWPIVSLNFHRLKAHLALGPQIIQETI